MSAGPGQLGPVAAVPEDAAGVPMAKAPSKIVVRNTFIDVTSSTPSSPVVRSCPPTASLPYAWPAGPMTGAVPSLLRHLEAQAEQRRSPKEAGLVATGKQPLGVAGLLEHFSPTLSAPSPLQEVCEARTGETPSSLSPARPFGIGSALEGPQPPPWNSNLISELVANAAAILETHTPTLSHATPKTSSAEAAPSRETHTPTLSHATPKTLSAEAAPTRDSREATPLISSPEVKVLPTPPFTPAYLHPALQVHHTMVPLPWPLTCGTAPPGPCPTVAATGAPDAKAMARSFAAISSFAAIDDDEDEEEPSSVVEEVQGDDGWWRALEDVSPLKQRSKAPAPNLQQAVLPTFPSVGSRKHFLKSCKPCAFLYTKGCANGVNCEFCHLCEAGEKKRRVKEKTERKRRQLATKLGKGLKCQAADVQPVLPVGVVALPPGSVE
eukprot:CAMPEP_0175410320 /NCGR_PEP_ID=MMETSP0095-20121207/41556_1 /TAXON_ID=311494 /ORGANISM="Alexandrium monilatum, Strain CCMP3105" /LENGTH=437 /DNA_ID=CAMNT_0016709283 /DNA_START=14 /DNA_END=1324 /DNA_ORIENTATION=-